MIHITYLISPLTWISFFLGSIIGSFLNVCIFRIPENNFFDRQRSACRSCRAIIPYYRNIPILSYLMLKGKAHCCGAPISIQYPLVEFITGVLFIFCYWKFPFVLNYVDRFEVDSANLIRFIFAIIFVSVMLVCSVIDLRHMIIPDVISLPMILLSPIVVLIHPELDWKSSLFGVVVGGGLLYLIAWIYWLFRREVGMGFGDVKLLAAIGGWLGYQAIIPVVFTASIVGSIVGISIVLFKRNMDLRTAIPFGPFLAGGAVFLLLCGNKLEEWLFYISNLGG